jgi:hypothetical protein
MSSLPSVVECQAQESLASVLEKEYKEVMAEFEVLLKRMKGPRIDRTCFFRNSTMYYVNPEDVVVSLKSKSFHWTITSIAAVDYGWNANVTLVSACEAKATSHDIAKNIAEAWKTAVTAVSNALKLSDKYLDEIGDDDKTGAWRTLFSLIEKASTEAISRMEQVKATMEAAILRFRLLRVPPYFISFTDM